MTEQEIRDDERKRCAVMLRNWADEVLAEVMAGSGMLPETPSVLRMASIRLRDGAEHFMPSYRTYPP